MDKRPPRPHRPGSIPEVVLDEQPEASVVNQRRFDLPKRAATLTGMPAPAAPGSQPPPAPRLPGELAATLPAPRNPLQHLTVRRPTPPSSVVLARRTPVPPSDDPPAPAAPSSGQPEASLPPASQTPEAASVEALRRRAEAAEARRDELERRERVRAEAQSPGGWPPRVEQRSSTPVPSSGNAKADQALGASVRHLLAKAAPYLLAAAGIGGGVTAVAKPSADPAKADALLASQEAMRADVALLREQVAGMLKREAARDQYTRCLEESLDEIGEQVLPAQDRLGAAAPLRAYTKRCQRLRP